MNLSFLQLHKLCTYLLAAVGFLALLIPNILSPLMWVVVGVAVIVSWRFEPPAIQHPFYRQTWTQITVALFVGSLLLTVVRVFSEPIIVGAYLLSLLQINKLYNRSERRDYLHIYLISFLMLTLGSVLNIELSYAVLFLLYVVFATWALMMLHLRRELEDTQLTRHEEEWGEGEQVGVAQILQSRSLIRGSLLAYTSAMALLVFLGSSVFFVVFPRVGFRLFFQRNNPPRAVAGFSDRVRLGSFGTIQQNRSVVLRVEVWGESGQPLHHYFRGLAFDLYDGREWRRSQPNAQKQLVQFAGASVGALSFALRRVSDEERERIVYQEIYQEPLPMNVLFGIERPSRVTIPFSLREGLRNAPSLSTDPNNDTLFFSYPPKEQSGFRYYVESVPSDFWRFRRPLKPDARKRMLQLFTQMPQGVFSPRLKTLAEQITRGKTTVPDRARAIEAYLRKSYAYSLTRQPAQENPLEDFLFRQKSGHCEYFSTAMIMLLRSIGVPARQVTGFLGAEWNPYGNFYAVRQSHAHSWVEVLDVRAGWYRFDPTPYQTINTTQGRAWTAWAEDRFDALRLQWYKWVIEYDLEAQLGFLRQIAATFRSARSAWSGESSGGSSLRDIWRTIQLPVVLLLLLGGIGFLFWRRRFQRAHTLTAQQAFSRVSTIYLALLDALEKRGVARHPAETQKAFASRLADLSRSSATLDASSVLGNHNNLTNDPPFGLSTPSTVSPEKRSSQAAPVDSTKPSVSTGATKHHATSLPWLEPPIAALFSTLTDHYLTLRFGQDDVPTADIDALDRQAQAILQQIIRNPPRV